MLLTIMFGMRITRHIVCAGLLCVLICFTAWKMYGLMIEHIFAHRDTGYSVEERQRAILLDRIMGFYYFPTVVFRFPGLNNPKLFQTVISYPRAFFISMAVLWGSVLYGSGFLLFTFYRWMKRRTRHCTPTALRAK